MVGEGNREGDHNMVGEGMGKVGVHNMEGESKVAVGKVEAGKGKVGEGNTAEEGSREVEGSNRTLSPCPWILDKTWLLQYLWKSI